MKEVKQEKNVCRKVCTIASSTWAKMRKTENKNKNEKGDEKVMRKPFKESHFIAWRTEEKNQLEEAVKSLGFELFQKTYRNEWERKSIEKKNKCED